MNAPPGTVADRRRTLILRSDENRRALASVVGGLERQFALADVVIATARRVNRHRALFGVVAVGLVLAPIAARKWLGRAMWMVPLALEGFRLARSIGRARRSSPPALDD
jgi:hypothetical protein